MARRKLSERFKEVYAHLDYERTANAHNISNETGMVHSTVMGVLKTLEAMGLAKCVERKKASYEYVKCFPDLPAFNRKWEVENYNRLRGKFIVKGENYSYEEVKEILKEYFEM